MLIGYARVSTADPHPDHQVDALLAMFSVPRSIVYGHLDKTRIGRPALAIASQTRTEP